MTQEQVMSAVRWVLTTIGPLIVSHGYLTDGTWQMIAGTIISIVPFVWAMISHTQQGQIAKVAAMPEVSKITTTAAVATAAPSPKVVTNTGSAG